MSAQDQRHTAEKRKRMRIAVAAYLVVAALFAVFRISTGGSELLDDITSMWLMAGLLGASFVGGIGLFLSKNWGYWTAIAVLSLQIVRIRVDGFTYDVLSLFGIYAYASGEFSLGLSLAFDPRFNLSGGTSEPWWLGVNVFAAVLIGYLITSKRADE